MRRGRGLGPARSGLAVAWAAAVAMTLVLAPAGAGAVKVLQRDDGVHADVGFQLMLWAVGTLDPEIAALPYAGDNAAMGEMVEADARGDLYVRRGRLYLKGLAQPDVAFQFTVAYDGVGKDALTAATGSAQARNQDLYIWDAYVTVALDRRWANLTAGYLRPQVGRESITSAFQVDSFLKSLANTYPRLHLVGRSSGRETGLNLGGWTHRERLGLSYNFGIFDTNHEAIAGRAGGGRRWAPLWTGRVAVTVGDPEMDSYGLSYDTNWFGARRGATFAIDGTWQGRTDQVATPPPVAVDAAKALAQDRYVGGFDRNALWGIDLQANWDGWSFSAEHDWLRRDFCDCFVAWSGLAPGYTDRVWHLRLGYTLPLTGGRFLEPVAMLSRFDGDGDSAVLPGLRHVVREIGVNWYLDRHAWSVGLHYVNQEQRHGAEPTVSDDFVAIGLQLVL
jgi:hypothetical protein